MANKVQYSLPKQDLGKADIDLQVQNGSKKFGTLKISRGTVSWAHGGKTKKMSWQSFSDLIQGKKKAASKAKAKAKSKAKSKVAKPKAKSKAKAYKSKARRSAKRPTAIRAARPAVAQKAA